MRATQTEHCAAIEPTPHVRFITLTIALYASRQQASIGNRPSARGDRANADSHHNGTYSSNSRHIV